MFKRYWPLLFLITISVVSTSFLLKSRENYKQSVYVQPVTENSFKELNFMSYIKKYHLEGKLSDTKNIFCSINPEIDSNQISNVYTKLGKNIYPYSVCHYQGNYYVTYNSDLVYSSFVSTISAGSGKIPTSITKIDSKGNITTIKNIESAISDSFTELSFYFLCSKIVGSYGNNKIVLECGGREGPEITKGLITVDFESNKSEYINYCINPIESKTEYKDLDPTYTCYEQGKKKYFNGTLTD